MHLDHPQPKTPYDKLEQNVVVAGDTANGLLGLKFLNKLRNKGFNVFAVDGNHEHYSNVGKGRTIQQTADRFREDNPNVSSFGDIPVVGVNGWYQVSNGRTWFSYMNDGPNIIGNYPDLAAAEMNRVMYEDYKFLQTYLQKLEGKCVVVTHTAPCTETLDPKYEGHYSNEWYYNRLMYNLFDTYFNKILVWCHGHTHASADKVVSGVRVVCNPRGYPGENPDWGPMTIEVEI